MFSIYSLATKAKSFFSCCRKNTADVHFYSIRLPSPWLLHRSWETKCLSAPWLAVRSTHLKLKKQKSWWKTSGGRLVSIEFWFPVTVLWISELVELKVKTVQNYCRSWTVWPISDICHKGGNWAQAGGELLISTPAPPLKSDLQAELVFWSFLSPWRWTVHALNIVVWPLTQRVLHLCAALSQSHRLPWKEKRVWSCYTQWCLVISWARAHVFSLCNKSIVWQTEGCGGPFDTGV